MNAPRSFAAPEITVRELSKRQQRGEDVHLLDVRRPEEREIVSLGGELIPLQELPERLGEIEHLRNETLVVYCRSGARSGSAVHFLREHGFSGAVNLRGGVLAWANEIDPSSPTY